jgi:adenylyltransferase/sulfurtransferase
MATDLARYHRQMLLPGFGPQAQQRLLDSTAVILGCGALGSVAADMLCRAGVGHLVIIDRDFVELTNLQRQVLFDEQDIADALPKAEAARRKLARINSGVKITAIVDDINAGNIESFCAGADVLLDGLDNFETRYLVNDVAVKHGTPYLYGGAVGSEGMAFAILPRDGQQGATPCLRCLFGEAPAPGQAATCDTAGVLGPAVAIIANFQVAEALKILTGNCEQVSTGLLNIDLWNNSLLRLAVDGMHEQQQCPCCQQRQYDYLDGRAGSQAIALCGRDAVQLRHRQQADGLDLAAIARRLDGHGTARRNEFMLRVTLSEHGHDYELSLFKDGRAIIKGTADPAVARGLYAKYVGN